MGAEMFLGLLGVITVLVMGITQVIKEALDKKNKIYSSNLIALIVSIVSSSIVSVLFFIIFDIGFSLKSIAEIIALMIASWATSMLGYDKIAQLICQLISIGKLK